MTNKLARCSEQELDQTSNQFESLHEEWTSSLTWADFTCLDLVDADKLQPTAEAMHQLFGQQAATVRSEADLLNAIMKIKRDAEKVFEVVQDQVIGFLFRKSGRDIFSNALYCSTSRVYKHELLQLHSSQAEITQNIEDLDVKIENVDSQIKTLLKEHAALSVRRHFFSKRVQNLREHASVEAMSYQNFVAVYKEKEAVLLERSEQAKLGLESVEKLQQGLSKLMGSIREEISALKPKAQDLLLDVAADCVAAYQLSQNTDYMLAY